MIARLKNYKKTLATALLAATLIIVPFTKVQAQDVSLPEDELSKESVVPKFDNPTTVKVRNVTLANKIEAAVYYGANFSEAIESQYKVGVDLGYHFNEYNAIFINYAQWNSGLNTQYTNSLGASPYNLDYTRAPTLQSSTWLNYEWYLYYGKISVTKQTVMNISVYPILGVGMTAYSNKSYFGGNGGIGTKFFFSPHWALRADFKIQYQGQPSPFLTGYMVKSQPVPSPGQFSDTYAIGTVLDIGIAAIF
jgi:outer membrane beta-barrel protein